MKFDEDKINEKINSANEAQWHQIGDFYFPAKPTVSVLPPGFYEVFTVYGEIRLARRDIPITGIFPTASANTKEILADVEQFWGSRDLFEEFEVPFKRGIFLSGPPGSGKTCILKLISSQLTARGGAILDVKNNVQLVGAAMDMIRKIHPQMPLIIVMEDVDRWVKNQGIELILNILDGMIHVDSVIFFATANNTDDLDDAILNRPGRFDVHYKILPPHDDVRRKFISKTLKSKKDSVNIDQWTKDTVGLSLGHIKELVISVMVFGKNYDETMERLRNMRTGKMDPESLIGDGLSNPHELIEEPTSTFKRRATPERGR